MKMKLPNGIEIEADKITVNPDGTVTLTDYKTDADRVPDALANLSDAQLRTYRALEKAGGRASVSYIADELEITSGAASQRMRILVDAGLVERTAHAHYKIVGS